MDFGGHGVLLKGVNGYTTIEIALAQGASYENRSSTFQHSKVLTQDPALFGKENQDKVVD